MRAVRSALYASRSERPSSAQKIASVSCCRGVSIMPGEMLLTRMPCAASATAAERVSESTAALVAA